MRFHILFLVPLVLIPQTIQAQRYLNPVFEEVEVQQNIVYGVNATANEVWVNGELVPDTLELDFYEPAGDINTNRPLVLVLHGGFFLPPVTNGTTLGTHRDSSVVETCRRLAKYGYTSAAINYRLGWNPLAAMPTDRATGLIQAVYRVMQDGRTAVRFFKQQAVEADNPWGIDTSRIPVWGNKISSMATLSMATVQAYDQLLQTQYPPAKFILDTDGDGIPDQPMVLEELFGDPE
ncbi:MAG: hypothetical protein AAGH79_01760, partial [Bacteroidota bacterium]